MDSGKRVLGLMLVLVMAATLGCARNKQQQAPVYPAGTGVAPASQPYVSPAAPASTGTSSNRYIK